MNTSKLMPMVRSLTLSIILASFLASATSLLPNSTVSAASIPKGFASREACLKQVAALPAEDIAAYGQERAKNRIAALDKFKTQVESKYKTQNAAIEKAAAAYKKQTGQTAPDNLKKVNSHKAELLAEIEANRTTVNTLKSAIDAASAQKDQAALAEKSCALLYDLKIYLYFGGKLQTQYSVDGLSTMVAVANIQRESVTQLYEKNKSKDAVKALAGAVSGMPKPKSREPQIAEIQKQVEAVSVTTVTQDGFKAIIDKIAATKKDISGDSKAISSVSAKVTAAVRKKAKKASNSSSSPASPSSSSSPSSPSPSSSPSSSNSSSSSSTPAKPAKAKKIKAKKALKCKSGMEVKSVAGKDKCVTTCNKNEVRSARNPVNCVCPQDFRRPTGKPRSCVHKFDLLPACITREASRAAPGGSSLIGPTRLVPAGYNLIYNAPCKLSDGRAFYSTRNIVSR